MAMQQAAPLRPQWTRHTAGRGQRGGQDESISHRAANVWKPSKCPPKTPLGQCQAAHSTSTPQPARISAVIQSTVRGAAIQLCDHAYIQATTKWFIRDLAGQAHRHRCLTTSAHCARARSGTSGAPLSPVQRCSRSIQSGPLLRRDSVLSHWAHRSPEGPAPKLGETVHPDSRPLPSRWTSVQHMPPLAGCDAMCDYTAVSTRTLTSPTIGTISALQGTCWCKSRSQSSCPATLAKQKSQLHPWL